MDITKSSFDKRQSVQKNYDLIAEQYSNEFGTYIEDLDVYEKFEQHLVENAKILDLGQALEEHILILINKIMSI